MDRIEVLRSSTRTPWTIVSSGLHPVATERGLQAGGDGLLTTVFAASSARVSLDRIAASRTVATGSRRSPWSRVRPALSSIEGIVARGAAPARPAAAVKAADAAEIAAPKPPKEPAGTPRVELTIDSLRNYDLVRPIPVVVESLGDRHYVAEVPDLNISTSASSLSDILIILKDQVAQTYDRLRIKKNLDAEQTRQLKTLDTYIGKVRRSWLDRR